MTVRQAIELVFLYLACIASLRTWFWKGTGLAPLKKLGLLLMVIVAITLTLFILYH